MYLLDTNVVSELRKAPAGRANPHVVAWAEAVSATELYISVVTLLELEIGVLGLERRDVRQGAILRRWLEDRVIPAFADRTFNVDTETALRCARLHVPDRRSEMDAVIAATALVHGLTVVTRNVGDFDGTGVRVVNPWAA